MKKRLKLSLEKMFKKPIYRFLLILFNLPALPLLILNFLRLRKNNNFLAEREEHSRRGMEEGLMERFRQENLARLARKQEFFQTEHSLEKLNEMAGKLAAEDFDSWLDRQTAVRDVGKLRWLDACLALYDQPLQLLLSLVLALPLHVMALIYSFPYAKFIAERIFMMIFVIFGVTWLVFTIMYISPMDPAKNVLGELATQEQVAEFRRVYGLDQPYLIQLQRTFRNLMTFNLGKSYVGSEDVMAAIMRKFPITLLVTLSSLLLAVILAIPAGIISAIKQYSSYDYIFMILALIGLSVPNFWLGLILILNFSIRAHWLPASFISGNWKTLIMPAIVLGTGLSASSARMTRSSMLEVKNMGYVMTARAKGLSERKVVLRHILGNAMIPIVTIVGLQFGGMLGGAAVTEKVFNISGIGSYIVDKQFIPDIPIVLAGVVYVALVISLANLLVDLTYSFLDPRIKSRMRAY